MLLALADNDAVELIDRVIIEVPYQEVLIGMPCRFPYDTLRKLSSD